VPAGVYGASRERQLQLGVGSGRRNRAADYELQGITLNGNASVSIVGPVKLKLANSVAMNGSIGSTAHPEWLQWEIANGGLTLNGQATVYGIVTAPNGAVTINGHSMDASSPIR